MANVSSGKTAFRPVLDRILNVYAGPDAESNPLYKAFYDELLTRCVADAAGILQSSKSETDDFHPGASRIVGSSSSEEQKYDSRPGSELNAVFKALAGKHGEKQARELILGNLQGFTKGIVYTPHPTELLNEAAIDAQENVMAALIKMPEFFELRGANADQNYSNKEVKGKLHAALKELSEAITHPVSEQLNIGQEMRRSVRFSQHQFDAIPGIADTILAATRSGVSHDLSQKELAQFSHLIAPETWSPGDQDSKPDMTVDKLEKGANLSRRAIMFHYFRTLAVLGSDVQDTSEETQKAIYAIMHRVLKTGCEAYDTKKKPTIELAREKLVGISEADIHGENKKDQIKFAKDFAPVADSSFFRGFSDEKRFDMMSAAAKPYANSDELLRDLGNLREMGHVNELKDKRRKCITVMDSLLIQAMNFGDSALRIQVRQNAERHSEVLDTVLGMLPPESVPAAAKGDLHSEASSAGVEALLAKFKSDGAFRQQLQETVKDKLGFIKQKIAELPPENAKDYKTARKEMLLAIGGGDEGKGQKNFEMYQTMATLGLAASHPDRIPRYLIAECRSKTHILEAFFLLKVMESVAAPDMKEKVEIVNLVEHPDRVMDNGSAIAAAQMTAGAFDNEQYREHHLSISSGKHLLQGYSLGKGQHDLTVAETKRTYGGIDPKARNSLKREFGKGDDEFNAENDGKPTHGIMINEGDEDRKIAGVKMMMGAGSDITKAGSSAAAAAMMDATDKTRIALLNNPDYPVQLIDYIGCGGGVHRTQPVSTSYETVQGQSMRQSPENVAQKVLGVLTTHLHQQIALNPDSEPMTQADKYLAKSLTSNDRKLMARVNLSNLAGLPQNEAMWQEHTRPRTYAMMSTYGKLYDSPDFEALLSYSGNMYAELTKFAARPSNREGTKAGDGFQAPVNVAKTRAIGFGAALNVAGICAPLFFGGSEYLKADNEKQERELREMYLFDPKAQDTVNRMTYGVIMADMDVAWKYLGHEHPPTSAELAALAASEPTVAGKEPTAVERHAMAEKSLAGIHIEYNKVAGQLLRLHQSVIGSSFSRRRSEITDGKQASTELLATLPAALREQLTMSRQHIDAPRQALADLFMKMDKGEVDPKTVIKGSGTYNDIIYPAMGTLFECFEHTPRAYTRPKWVKATEQQFERAA